MAAGTIRYIYNRGGRADISHRDATNQYIVIVDKSITVITCLSFDGLHNIIEVICHEGVEQIEGRAFWKCTNLRRVIMPGVRVVEETAFADCISLTDLECGKLEIIESNAFEVCESLRNINLPSLAIFFNPIFFRSLSIFRVLICVSLFQFLFFLILFL